MSEPEVVERNVDIVEMVAAYDSKSNMCGIVVYYKDGRKVFAPMPGNNYATFLLGCVEVGNKYLAINGEPELDKELN